jgi:hypothetical protein
MKINNQARLRFEKLVKRMWENRQLRTYQYLKICKKNNMDNYPPDVNLYEIGVEDNPAGSEDSPCELFTDEELEEILTIKL